MKVFISADIEGVTTTTQFEECRPSDPSYPKHAEQMTKEVLAAVEGCIAAGATEIVVKDAHGPACNIDITQMPECVSVIRSWTGHPYLMAYGVDSTFDAAMFVGYHSAAGRCGNPLSHTVSGSHIYTKINGRYVSEFMLYSYACTLEGVPTVLLTGDKMLCEDYQDLHPNLVTVPVKDGLGGLTINYSPAKTLRLIKEGAEAALKQDLTNAGITLPEHFVTEICFKQHAQAEKASHFPGVIKVSDNIVRYETDSFLEVLRTYKWII